MTHQAHPLWRQVLNLVAFAVVLVINGLAGSGALSGSSIGEIANRYSSSFLPASYVFGIWSLIYLWLAIFAVYQALPARRSDQVLGRLGMGWVFNAVLNVAWIVTFSFALFWPAWAIMIGLLVNLVWIHERIGLGSRTLDSRALFFVAYPFALYLAWISVALISNTFQLVTYVGWGGFGIDGAVWSAAMMIVGAGLSTFMVFHRGNWIFPLVFAWAFVGLAVRYPETPIIFITAYTTAGAGLLTLVAGLVWRARRSGGRLPSTAATLIPLVTLFGVVGCAPSGERAGEASDVGEDLPGGAPVDTVTVLAYNIHHGEGMDSVLDLERIAALIRSADPDLVALQEIDSVTTRTGEVDQAAELGRLTGLTPVYGRFMAYRGGAYGMALLSRWPISTTTNYPLPDGEEPRTALSAVVTAPASGRLLRFVGIHFYRTEAERLAQARALEAALERDTIPTILAGDFNSTPDSEVMDFLRESWHVVDKGTDRLTFSSWDPVREIDYVLMRPFDRFEVLGQRLLDEPVASDHRPVLVEFVLR